MELVPLEKAISLVVLCHTLTSEEYDLSASIVRERWPGAKIVAVSEDPTSSWNSADGIVRGIDGPSVLLKVLESVLRHYP